MDDFCGYIICSGCSNSLHSKEILKIIFLLLAVLTEENKSKKQELTMELSTVLPFACACLRDVWVSLSSLGMEDLGSA